MGVNGNPGLRVTAVIADGSGSSVWRAHPAHMSFTSKSPAKVRGF